MPEGDTVWRTARRQHEALAGRELTGFDLRVPRFATADLAGATVLEVLSRGKHLLHRIGEFTLHTHLGMDGRWDLVAPGERWRRPAFEARAVLDTDAWQSVGFALRVTELLARDEEHRAVGHLGPDPLGPTWDAAEAQSRLGADPGIPAFIAVLDQRNLAGIGNVYASELLFLRGIAPTTPIGEVFLGHLVVLAARLLVANRERSVRTTTGDARRGRNLWVYGRAGQPCRRCGTRIRSAKLGPTPLTQRDVYWCPQCQR